MPAEGNGVSDAFGTAGPRGLTSASARFVTGELASVAAVARVTRGDVLIGANGSFFLICTAFPIGVDDASLHYIHWSGGKVDCGVGYAPDIADAGVHTLVGERTWQPLIGEARRMVLADPQEVLVHLGNDLTGRVTPDFLHNLQVLLNAASSTAQEVHQRVRLWIDQSSGKLHSSPPQLQPGGPWRALPLDLFLSAPGRPLDDTLASISIDSRPIQRPLELDEYFNRDVGNQLVAQLVVANRLLNVAALANER